MPRDRAAHTGRGTGVGPWIITLALVVGMLAPGPTFAQPSTTALPVEPLEQAIALLDVADDDDGAERSRAIDAARAAIRDAAERADARFAAAVDRVERFGLPRVIATRAMSARTTAAAWFAAIDRRLTSAGVNLRDVADSLRRPPASVPPLVAAPSVTAPVRSGVRSDPSPVRIVERLRRRLDLGARAGSGSELRPSKAIDALARRLGPDPLAAVNWVRRHVLYRPGWGITQGAAGCRRSLECNAQDTAALLVSVLRATGSEARFVTGVVQVTPALFDSAVGGVDNVDTAIYAAAVGGLEVTKTVADDGSDALVLPHVWVEVRRGDAWVPLDATLKRTRLIAPMSVEEMIGLNPVDVMEDLRGNVGVDASLPAATDVDAKPITRRIAQLTGKLEHAFAREIPAGATVGDVVGSLEPRAPVLRSLGEAAPPGDILEISSRGPSLPNDQQVVLHIAAPAFDGQGEGLDASFPLAKVLGRRLTFLFPGATAADRATIAEHGGLYSTPPYLLELRPALQLDGKTVAMGDAAPMGFFQEIDITITSPNGDTTAISHVLRIGGFAALGLDPMHRTSADLRAARQPITRTLAYLKHPKGRLTSDSLIGAPLHAQAQLYWAIVDHYARYLANQQGLRVVRFPGELLMTAQPAIVFDGDVPAEIGAVGLSMDAQQLGYRGLSRGTPYDPAAEADYLEGLGAYTSAVEHGIFELTAHAPSVSTVVVLDRAARDGNPVFGITAQTISLVDQLDAPDNVKANVRSYAGAGFTVFIPRDPVTINDWTGWGWIVQDYDSGLYAYLLAGSLHGGATTEGSDPIDGLSESLQELSGDAAQYYLEHKAVIKGVGNLTKWTGPVGAGISGGVEYVETYEETGSPWKAAAAGVTKTVAQLAADAAMEAYVAAGATGVVESAAGGLPGVAVSSTVVVTTGVALGYAMDQTVQGITEFAKQAAPQ